MMAIYKSKNSLLVAVLIHYADDPSSNPDEAKIDFCNRIKSTKMVGRGGWPIGKGHSYLL